MPGGKGKFGPCGWLKIILFKMVLRSQAWERSYFDGNKISLNCTLNSKNLCYNVFYRLRKLVRKLVKMSLFYFFQIKILRN